MLPLRELRSIVAWMLLALPVVATSEVTLIAAEASGDLVVLADRSERRGVVVSVDRQTVIVELAPGKRETLRRSDVVRIEFGEAAPRLVSARVRVFDADDVVRILLDGREVAPASQLRSEWVDLAPLLREGANRLEGKVDNAAGYWSFRWVLEIAGKKTVFACGMPGRSGCRAEGAAGNERGEQPGGSAWLFVDEKSGTVAVEVDPVREVGAGDQR